ncbi:NUDIX hydrolase [Nocardia sp. NBC_01329]|uniref:NUDIX hydrolase n=1 Tax=Nocardia sp. NBC_01329 TaxID=2903594 RepID=UPI002E0EE844|nr:NUDIX domain-containing protein [Nocardia sp. NBC_01329]
MSFRLAAYAVCIRDRHVLLARHVRPDGARNWTLPGGRVEHAEDPFHTVRREVREETGYIAEVRRLLGVDSRLIPAAERAVPGGSEHQNIGIFYEVRLVGGRLRAEPNGETDDPTWTPISEIPDLRRSSLVDIGIALARSRPATGRTAPVPVGGLIQH